MLQKFPTNEEIKAAVLSLHPDSTAGPGRFNRKFYEISWHIISEDVYNMIKDIFKGGKLTKFFTHT